MVRQLTIACFLPICVLLSLGGTAGAMSRKSELTSEVGQLGQCIRIYHEREGKFPETWEELSKVAPDLDRIMPVLNPTRRMVLVSPPFELPRRYHGGAVVAMTRDAFRPLAWKQSPVSGIREYLGEPAHAVIVWVDGGTFLRRVPPDGMKSTFEELGLPTPQPSNLGKFPHEREFMIRRIVFAAGSLVLVVLTIGIWWSFRKLRQRGNGSGIEAD